MKRLNGISSPLPVIALCAVATLVVGGGHGRSMAEAAAEAAVHGTVVSAGTGEPVAGAFIRAGADGPAAIAEVDGSFHLLEVPLGAIELVVVADLFAPLAVEVTVTAGMGPITLELAPAASRDAEIIVVTDEAPASVEPTTYALAAADIRLLPGSGNDALKSLQSLPGAARIPFGLGGLVLRGSSPRDTNVYLDGVEVPLLYHFGGLASFFPSAMLETLEMIPGGSGARYGRAQGGVVTMEARRGRTDRWRVSSEVSLTDAAVRADGPGPLGGSWSLGLRRSYVDALLAAVVPDDSSFSLTLAPRYYDGQLRYDVDLGPGTRVVATVFGSDDRLRLLTAPDRATDDDFQFSYVSSFVRASLRLQRRQGPFDFTVTPWIGRDESSILAGEDRTTRTTIPMGLRAEVGRTFESGYLAGGLDVQGGRFGFDLDNRPPPMPGVARERGASTSVARSGAVWFADVGSWLEGLYRVGDGSVAIKPGLRAEYYGLTDEWTIDPRLGASQKLTSWLQLEQSVGVYHQPAVFADLDPSFGNPELHSSYSVQAAAGVRALPTPGVEASVTGFYEEMYDLPVDAVTSASGATADSSPLAGGVAATSREFTVEQFGSYSYQENLGRGRAYGAEFLARAGLGTPGRAGSVIGWLSYTYSRSLRRDDPARYADYRPYVLDQPHVLTALGSYALTDGWQFGARLRFASGNPITPVAGAYFDADAQRYRSIPGAILSERLPAFFQLDLRVDRRWRRSWGTITVFADIQNVTNRVNPEGVTYDFDYSRVQYTRGLPIFPSIGVEYRP